MAHDEKGTSCGVDTMDGSAVKSSEDEATKELSDGEEAMATCETSVTSDLIIAHNGDETTQHHDGIIDTADKDQHHLRSDTPQDDKSPEETAVVQGDSESAPGIGAKEPGPKEHPTRHKQPKKQPKKRKDIPPGYPPRRVYSPEPYVYDRYSPKPSNRNYVDPIPPARYRSRYNSPGSSSDLDEKTRGGLFGLPPDLIPLPSSVGSVGSRRGSTSSLEDLTLRTREGVRGRPPTQIPLPDSRSGTSVGSSAYRMPYPTTNQPHPPYRARSRSGSSYYVDDYAAARRVTKHEPVSQFVLPAGYVEGVNDESPSRLEWLRQKSELGEKNYVLDWVMSMVGLEEVKAFFLQLKGRIEAARRRHDEKLGFSGLNLVLWGGIGTGKKTIGRLYAEFLESLDVVPKGSFYTISSPEVINFPRGNVPKVIFFDKVHRFSRGLSDVDDLLLASEVYAKTSILVFSCRSLVGGHQITASPEVRWRIPTILTLPDHSDDELLRLLVMLFEYRKLGVEGGFGDHCLRVVVRRVSKGRGLDTYGNARSVQAEFERILNRQVDRLRGEWTEWERKKREKEKTAEGKQDGEDKASKGTEVNGTDKDDERQTPDVVISTSQDRWAPGYVGPQMTPEQYRKKRNDDMRPPPRGTPAVHKAKVTMSDHQTELRLLEEANKNRLMMACRDQDIANGYEPHGAEDTGQDLAAENEAGSNEEDDKEEPDDPENPRPNDKLITRADVFGPEPEDLASKSDAWKELQAMTGLQDVKRSITDLLDRSRYNYHREIEGKSPLQTSLNRVFLGPPGTGKTTAARLYAKVLADLSLLTNGKIILKTPADFFSPTVGDSEEKIADTLDSAQGNILIIDDAHGFYLQTDSGSNKTDTMRQAIVDILVAKISGAPGEDRCVILTGYADVMEEMFRKGNSGLRRRFPEEQTFVFKDFGESELGEIFDLKLKEYDLAVTDEAKLVAQDVLNKMRIRANFGNGAAVESLISQARARHRETTHSSTAGQPTDQVATILNPEDFDPDHDRAQQSDCRTLFAHFVGLEKVIDLFSGYQQMTTGMRLHNIDPRPHIPFGFVFKGAPGTGKTSTARKVGRIFYSMGFLSSDEVIECSATDMVGEWLGTTGPKVLSLLDKALGKVLLIDEAYRLGSGSRGTSGSNYHEEAISELVDAMTKPRYAQKMIIILAGYDGEMERLMDSNPGLRGRFPTQVVFPDMKPEHCLFHLLEEIGKLGIELTDGDGEEGDKEVLRLFRKLGRTKHWANGRDVETLGRTVIGSVFRRQGVEVKRGLSVSTGELMGFLQDMLRERKRKKDRGKTRR